jgi:hypothetical protein
MIIERPFVKGVFRGKKNAQALGMILRFHGF